MTIFHWGEERRGEERGSGDGWGKDSTIGTISWQSYPWSNQTFLWIITKIKTCKELQLSAVSVLKSHCVLWLLFARRTLASLLNKQQSQVSLLASPALAHDSPPTWGSHQHLQLRTEKLGFLATETSTKWKHRHTTDCSSLWMEDLPRAQGWDMHKSDLPMQSHQERLLQHAALAYPHWGHGPSFASLCTLGKVNTQAGRRVSSQKKVDGVTPLVRAGFPTLMLSSPSSLLRRCCRQASGISAVDMLAFLWTPPQSA